MKGRLPSADPQGDNRCPPGCPWVDWTNPEHACFLLSLVRQVKNGNEEDSVQESLDLVPFSWSEGVMAYHCCNDDYLSLAKLHIEPKLSVGDLCNLTLHGLLGSETVCNAAH